MAEQLDLSINIGANTQDLQAELQKAQNLLGQFQAALKKATNVGEINYLNNQIKNLNSTISSLQTSMGNVKKPSADATQALTNLSRVAQDAPYGFMGIANNLNPLLESFQQLSAKSKDSGGALKALGQGLIGPAGLGLALGVVSSVIVKFGDEIQKFITEKAVGLGKAFTQEAEVISKGAEGFVKAQVEISNLNNEFTRYTTGVSTKEEFLKKFNDTLGDTIKETKDLATAEKFLGEYADDYVKMTFKKAIATEAATQAAKKQVQAELEKNKPITPGLGTIVTSAFASPAKIGVQAAESKNALLKGLNEQVNTLQKIRDKYNTEANNIDASLRKVFGGPDIKTKKEKTDNTFSSNLRKENNLILYAIKKRAELAKTATYITSDTAQEKVRAAKKRETDIAAFGKGKMTGGLGDSLKGATSSFYEEQKKIAEAKGLDIELTKKQTEANLQFADSVSNYATNAIMGLWSALESGQNIGQALGAVFMDLAKQIAAAALKALAFQAVLSLIPGFGAAAGVASGGFGSLFKGFLGLASGGVVTKPTLAMVGEGNESEAVMPLSKLGSMMQNTFDAGAMSGGGAANGGNFVLRGNDLVLALQRSNYSLNLRRGA